MIYSIKAKITLDTRSAKVIIESEDKRIVLYPGKKIADHWVDVSLNDRPQGAPFSYAKDICKFLCQSLHDRKQIRKIAKEAPNG